MDELRNTDPEDIYYLLLDVEKFLGIRFGRYAFQHVTTFGELCAVIEALAGQMDTGGCTSQQAYYKLRTALRAEDGSGALTPDTTLEELFPRPNRRQRLARLEQALGVKLNLLSPTEKLSSRLWLGLLAAGISCWLLPAAFGASVVALAVLALYLAYRFGKELRLQTVREVVQQLATEHYARARRHPGTVNRQEVRALVRQLFAERLDLAPEALHPQAAFN